jgi:hypothetical protein
MEKHFSGGILKENIAASYKYPTFGETFKLTSFLTGGFYK